MTIRIGSSCSLSPSMGIGKVVETRRLIGSVTAWEATAKQAVRDKQYLIVTPCINRNDGSGHYPGDSEWVNFVSTTCTKLKSFGGNKSNSRISLVNEPMKFCTKEQYKHLIDLAYPIVKANGFLMGAGNEEFLTAQAKGNMYQYILANCLFDILDIHIQGSCDTKAHTDQWINEVKSWKAYWNKPVDCTEAFYGDCRTSNGYNLLKYQCQKAEEIGCENFCNVFNNLDSSQFPFDTSDWHKLCFKIDGQIKSNYWAQWKIEMDTRGPVPNINIPKPKGIDGMIIKTIGHKTNDIQSGYGVELLHELLIYKKYIEDVENMFVYDTNTRQAVESFQTDLGITIDGRVGRQTWRKFINSITDDTIRAKFQFEFEVVMSPYNIKGDT